MADQEFNVDKLNDCMLLSLLTQKHQLLFDRGVDMMATFSEEHIYHTEEGCEYADKIYAKRGKAFSPKDINRQTIIVMMMDDLYEKMKSL